MNCNALDATDGIVCLIYQSKGVEVRDSPRLNLGATQMRTPVNPILDNDLYEQDANEALICMMGSAATRTCIDNIVKMLCLSHLSEGDSSLGAADTMILQDLVTSTQRSSFLRG